MSKTEADLDRWVNECAEYLIEKRKRDLFFSSRQSKDKLKVSSAADIPFINMMADMQRREVLLRGGNPENVAVEHLSFYDYEGLMSELDSAEKEIQAVLNRITKLRAHFELGEMIPFDGIGHGIESTKESLTSAWLEIRRAREDVIFHHPPGTRAKPLHKAAVRLAYAAVDPKSPRRTRKLAKRIMFKAGLEAPEEKSLTNWIREVKAE